MMTDIVDLSIKMMVSKHVNFDFQFLMRDENSYKSSRKWWQSFQTLNSHCFRMEIITEESLLTGHPLQNSH